MKTYQVTWGDEEAIVYAEDSVEAWSKFVAGNGDCCRHPNLHPREVVEVTLDKHGKPTPVVVDEDDAEPGVSPMVDVNADEAKDKISRMTSHDKLQAIVDYDTRSTVVAAASARQDELGGS